MNVSFNAFASSLKGKFGIDKSYSEVTEQEADQVYDWYCGNINTLNEAVEANKEVEVAVDLDDFEKIKKVLDGTEESVNISRRKLVEYINFIKTELNTDEHEYDSNGYQVDFWVAFETPCGDKTFELTGDLWYEDTFKFEQN